MKTIKTLCLAVLAVFVFSNATCDKKIKIEKTVDGASATFIALPQPAGTFDFNEKVVFDMAAELSQYNVTLDDLIKVEPESATITIIDSTATPVTFDIVDMVNLELGSTTIPNQRVAYKDPVPHTGLTVISPDIVPATDFMALVKGTDINYHFTGKLNAALTHQVKMKVSIKWKITAELAP